MAEVSTDFVDWLNANPGLAGLMAGFGSVLADPGKDATTTKQETVNLPDYIAPYVQRVLQKAESVAGEGYVPYSGQRVAGFNDDQQRAFQLMRSMSPTTAEQTAGTGIVGEAARRLLDTGSRTWDSAAAEQYMNPYMQGVVDIEKAQALRDFQQQQGITAAKAAKAGAFGGDRFALIESEANRNFNDNLQKIQATGLRDAYTNAQTMFDKDMSRTAAGLVGASSAGKTLADIGQTGFQNQLALQQGILGIGNQQQQNTQQGLDVGYQNFVAQRDAPLRELSILQQGMQGLPVTQTNTANTTPAPTLAQQLISAGIGGFNLGTSTGTPK